jgi:hypothetical protein
MAIILHILKKDLRATWNALAVASIILILHVIGAQFAASSLGNYQWRPFGVVSLLILLLMLYLNIIGIVDRLIHEDSLIGTSSFWMTRPISRNSLFWAKGLYIFLFLVLVPIAVDFILLLHFGMKSFQVFPFLFTLLAAHLAIICTFVCLAAITPNRKFFALVAPITLICLVLAEIQMDSFDWRRGWISAFTIFAPLLLSVMFGVSAHQFLTRKTKRSIALMIGGFVTVWLGCLFFNWAHRPLGTQSSIDATLLVNFVPMNKAYLPSYENATRPFSNNPLNRPISANVVLQGLAVSEEVMLTHVNGQLDFQTGERILYTGKGYGQNYGIDKTTQTLLPGFQLKGFFQDLPVEVLSVSESQYKELCNRGGIYTGEAQFNVYRDAIVSEVRLIKGARIIFGQNPISIMTVAVERNPAPVPHLSVYLESIGLKLETDRNDEFYFCVLNRTHLQFVPFTYDASPLSYLELLIVPGIDLGHLGSHLQFYIPMVDRLPLLSLDDAWMADAHLVVIHRDYIGQISRKFEIKNFRMADYVSDN